MKYYAIYHLPCDREKPYETYSGRISPRSTAERRLIWRARFNGESEESFRKDINLSLLVKTVVQGLNGGVLEVSDLPKRLTTALGFVNPELLE